MEVWRLRLRMKVEKKPEFGADFVDWQEGIARGRSGVTHQTCLNEALANEKP